MEEMPEEIYKFSIRDIKLKFMSGMYVSCANDAAVCRFCRCRCLSYNTITTHYKVIYQQQQKSK